MVTAIRTRNDTQTYPETIPLFLLANQSQENLSGQSRQEPNVSQYLFLFTTPNDLLLSDINWYAGTLAGVQFTELMNKRTKFNHDKDNDALGLVSRLSYGHPILDYSGGDTDTSTYMARFPEEHFK